MGCKTFLYGCVFVLNVCHGVLWEYHYVFNVHSTQYNEQTIWHVYILILYPCVELNVPDTFITLYLASTSFPFYSESSVYSSHH